MCTQQITMYTILCTQLASTYRQGDVYSTTIAHHWNAEEQTIPLRYGRAIEELICRSSALETPPNLAHATSDRTNLKSTASALYHNSLSAPR